MRAKRRKTPKDKDPRAEQRGNRAQPIEELASQRVMLGFPAAILALWALHQRIVGAAGPAREEPRLSMYGPTLAEWELRRRVDELATEEELRTDFSPEGLEEIAEKVQDSLRELGEALRDGKIGVLLNRWWKEDKIKRGLDGYRLKGKVSLTNDAITVLKKRREQTKAGLDKEALTQLPRSLPRWTKQQIREKVALDVGLSGESALKRLLRKRPKGRIDPASIDPRLKKARVPVRPIITTGGTDPGADRT